MVGRSSRNPHLYPVPVVEAGQTGRSPPVELAHQHTRPGYRDELACVASAPTLTRVPRVSAGYAAQRRRHILDAALRCFARSGLQATSMDDIIGETGMSSGTVYRWFRSKDDIITTAVADVFGDVSESLERMAAIEPPPPLAEIVGAVLTGLPGEGGVDRTRIGIMAWAEALRSPEVGALLRDRYQQLIERLADLVRRRQNAGLLAPELDPQGAATALFALIPGFVVHQQLVGGTTPEAYANAIAVLLDDRALGARKQ